MCACVFQHHQQQLPTLHSHIFQHNCLLFTPCSPSQATGGYATATPASLQHSSGRRMPLQATQATLNSKEAWTWQRARSAMQVLTDMPAPYQQHQQQHMQRQDTLHCSHCTHCMPALTPHTEVPQQQQQQQQQRATIITPVSVHTQSAVLTPSPTHARTHVRAQAAAHTASRGQGGSAALMESTVTAHTITAPTSPT